MSGSRSSGNSGGRSGNSGGRSGNNSGGRSGNSNAAGGGALCCCLFFSSGNKNNASCSSGGGGNYNPEQPRQQYMDGDEKVSRDYVSLPGGSEKKGSQVSVESNTTLTENVTAVSKPEYIPPKAAPLVEPSAPYLRMSSEGIPQEPQIEGQPHDLEPGAPVMSARI